MLNNTFFSCEKIQIFDVLIYHAKFNGKFYSKYDHYVKQHLYFMLVQATIHGYIPKFNLLSPEQIAHLICFHATNLGKII